MDQTLPTETAVENAKRLRKQLLLALYHSFIETPYAEMELSRLSEVCKAEASDLNWNMVYLEKSGLIEMGHSSDCPPFVSCTASITAAGVDLVETPGGLDEKF